MADWDGDGRFDILSGSEEEGVWWFRNVGSPAAPQFTAGQILVDLPSRAEGFVDINWDVPGVRTQTEATDYDGDGRLDLIVGDYAYGYHFKLDLTPEQRRTCEELFTAYRAAIDARSRKETELCGGSKVDDEALGRARDKLVKSPEHTGVLRASEAFKGSIRPHLELKNEPDEIRADGTKRPVDPLTHVRGNVWVYLRQ